MFTDNPFDKVEFMQDTDAPLDYDCNAYWLRRTDELVGILLWETCGSPQLEPSTGGALSGEHDVVLASAPPYQACPYGNYYLPDTSPLHGAGSRSVADAGLYHYTTFVTQTKEGEDTSKISPNINVNIGLHYIAADANGLPNDTDADGIPDYVENWHGDGLRNHTDETDWQNAMTVGMAPDATNSVYDDIDLSGDGLVGRIKRALEMNPFDPDNPLTLTQVSG